MAKWGEDAFAVCEGRSLLTSHHGDSDFTFSLSLHSCLYFFLFYLKQERYWYQFLIRFFFFFFGIREIF